LDKAISKKDFAGAVAEYKAELMLYTDDQSQKAGLLDTLHLAEAYANETPKDLVNAIWFYSRAGTSRRPPTNPTLRSRSSITTRSFTAPWTVWTTSSSGRGYDLSAGNAGC